MVQSDAQKRAQKKYETKARKEKYDQTTVRMPLGTKDRITALGATISTFIVDAVIEKLDREEQQ